jgi:thymidylate kinase
MTASLASLRVTLTGPDGSGKSTACARVARLLTQRYGEGSVSRASVWDALSGSRVFSSKDAVTEYLATLDGSARTLFILHAMRQSIALAARAGARIVLIDGGCEKYAASELAYGVPEDIVLGACRAFPPSDLTLFLEVDPESAWSRKLQASRYEQGGESGGQREGFIRFQARMGAAWKRLEARLGPWKHLPAGDDPEALSQRVFAECIGLLEE